LDIFEEFKKISKNIKRSFKFKGEYEKGKKLIICVASDRGLAGSFDYLIFKKTEEFLMEIFI
jgi:F0F1-type ATP synthase gamma subunit